MKKAISKRPLRVRGKAEHSCRTLPFVDGQSFWDVPATGGHVGGCITGNALASIFLKHLRSNPDDAFVIRWALFEMMDGASELNADERMARKAQAIGFLEALEKWVVSAVRACGAGLELLDVDAALVRANHGLTFSDDAYPDLAMRSNTKEEAIC
jgi:hypothetical protein